MISQGQPFFLPRRQVRALLYRLAAANQPVPREELADLFWPDKSPAIARRNLTRLLSYLRGQLPNSDLLQVHKTAVALNPDLASSDVMQFMQLCAGDDVARWEKAVSIYNGPFLAGFTMNDSIIFDNWLSQERQRFERQHLKILRQLVVCPSLEPEKAVRFGNMYLAIDDLAEEIHRYLIELYARTGKRSTALRQFETCVLVLERELGVAPLPETRAAYEAARDGHQLATPQKLPEPEWATLPSLDLPLIGREAAWEQLETAHGHFRSGGVIFISGEPGVGKSRLMQDFATSQSSFTLTGNSPPGNQTMPYEPLVQALRLALPFPDRWRHAQPIWLAEAARLLPELRVHFPDLPAAIEVEPDQAQARLFEALTQLFRSLATDSPLLLCLDDVHWADEATLGWLQYVAKRLKSSQICMVATYRSHEAAPLHDWQRALGRAKLMTDVLLDSLSETAVATLLRQTDENVIAPERLATRIHAATGGNTFFVLETVRELLETNQLTNPPPDLPLPATVRETILRRTGRLTPLAQQILEITAVLSPSLTFPVIHQTAGRGDMETAEGLKELAQHHLLLADDDRFHFQHDLAREAVYQNITSWRQQLLHRRAATALENQLTQEETELPAIIAAHFEAANEKEQAITYFRRAATSAKSLYAHQEAVAYLKRAIKLTGEDGDKNRLLPQLHEALADSLAIAGKFPAAEAAYRTSLSLIPNDDPLLLAELERKLAGTLPAQQRTSEAEKICRAALNRLDRLATTDITRQTQSQRLNIILSLLDTLYFQGKSEGMDALKELTEALLEDVGTAVQRSHYASRLDQIAFIRNRHCAPSESIANAQSALRDARESGNMRLIARQQFHLGFQLLWHVQWRDYLDDAEPFLQKSLKSAIELGDFWLQDQCLAYLTTLNRLQGSNEQVSAQLPRLIEMSHSVGYRNYIGVAEANAAWLHYCAGEWLQAQNRAEAAATSWFETTYPLIWLTHWILLALALRQNRLADAIAAAAAMLDPKQQKLVDEIDDVLGTAVSAYEANDEETARDCLETAVALATQHNYL